MKLLAIDGNSIANRAFYGCPQMHAPNGTPTNAIYGFISMTERMIYRTMADGLAVAFDMHEPTFRHQAYSDYKAGRSPAPDDFRVQMPILEQLLRDMSIPVITQKGYEADDILGTLSAMCAKDGWDCCIYTGDRDAFQLINDHSTVYYPKSGKGGTQTVLYDAARIAQEYNGLTPQQLIDIKALQGDHSDNISGVFGIGAKTALTLISENGSIEGVYSALDNGTLHASEKVKSLLQAGREDASFSKFLGTIRTDIPFDFSLDELLRTPMDDTLVYRDLKELGFQRFIDEWQLDPDLIER